MISRRTLPPALLPAVVAGLVLCAVAGGLVLAAAAAGGSNAGSGWLRAAPGFGWSFPRDHWSHPGFKTEWWYFTGHLAVDGEDTPRFGYQFTFFRIGLTPDLPGRDSAWDARGLIMGHAAVTDLAEGRHVFSDVLYREIPLLGGFDKVPDHPGHGGRIAWCLGPAGTSSQWELGWNGEGFEFTMADDARDMAFTLATRPEKPRVFQGPSGVSRKGSSTDAASLYYSFTRLHTEGTLRVGDASYPVSGSSWMDKEFGSDQMEEDQVGWDWWSLQLEDRREVMIYVLRNASGDPDHARGTVVSPGGDPRYLSSGDWNLRALGTWKSERTGVEYPSGWELGIPGEDLNLEIRPLLPDQENVPERSSRFPYWEGAVEITGDDGVRGRGYVELTGYGDGHRPGL